MGIADKIVDQVSKSEGFQSLEPEVGAAFRSRYREFLRVRAEGTTDDYIALMEEWGCTMNALRSSPEFAHLLEGWHPIGSDLCVAQVDPDNLEVHVLRDEDAASAFSRRWPRRDKRAMGILGVCLFSPKPPQHDMARASKLVLEIIYPAVTEDGTHLIVGIRWVWDNESRSWYPWVMHHEVEFGKPGPSQFF